MLTCTFLAILDERRHAYAVILATEESLSHAESIGSAGVTKAGVRHRIHTDKPGLLGV